MNRQPRHPAKLPHAHSECNGCLAKGLTIDALTNANAELLGVNASLAHSLKDANSSIKTLTDMLQQLKTPSSTGNASSVAQANSTAAPANANANSNATRNSHPQEETPSSSNTPNTNATTNANATVNAKATGNAKGSKAAKSKPTPKAASAGNASSHRKPQQCVLCGEFDRHRNMATHFKKFHPGYATYAKTTPGYPGIFFFNTDEKLDLCPEEHRRAWKCRPNVKGINWTWLGMEGPPAKKTRVEYASDSGEEENANANADDDDFDRYYHETMAKKKAAARKRKMSPERHASPPPRTPLHSDSSSSSSSDDESEYEPPVREKPTRIAQHAD